MSLMWAAVRGLGVGVPALAAGIPTIRSSNSSGFGVELHLTPHISCFDKLSMTVWTTDYRLSTIDYRLIPPRTSHHEPRPAKSPPSSLHPPEYWCRSRKTQQAKQERQPWQLFRRAHRIASPALLPSCSFPPRPPSHFPGALSPP